MPTRRKLVIFITLCLAYAALCVVVSPGSVLFDAADFFHTAQNWAATGIYGLQPGVSDMAREPGYSVFLGLCLRAFGGLAHGEGALISLLVFCQSLVYAATALALAWGAPLPRGVRLAYLALALTSGALLGANTDLYSETLAVSWLNLFLLASLCFARAPRGRWLALAVFSFTAALLTKSYLFYFLPFFLLTGLALLGRRSSRALGLGLCAVVVAGLIAQKAWDKRNETLFGARQEYVRVAVALAGKVMRAEEMQPSQEWRMGLMAAVGQNLCARFFGQDPCFRYSIWRVDYYGLPAWRDYKAHFSEDNRVAFRELRHDMLSRYFRHPLRQLYSSALEVVRITFFEAPPGSLERFHVPALLLQLWHVFGSLVIWALALFGIPLAARVNKEAAALCLLFLLAHYFFMSQVGNMTRYAFPFTPFLYLLAAFGANQLFKLREPRSPPVA